VLSLPPALVSAPSLSTAVPEPGCHAGPEPSSPHAPTSSAPASHRDPPLRFLFPAIVPMSGKV
jgi:hypothetical protein